MEALTSIMLATQIVVTLILIIMIMLQKSSSGALGGMGGSAMNSVFSVKTSHDIITKATLVLSVIFMLNALCLSTLYARQKPVESKVLEQLQQQEKASSKEELDTITDTETKETTQKTISIPDDNAETSKKNVSPNASPANDTATNNKDNGAAQNK